MHINTCKTLALYKPINFLEESKKILNTLANELSKKKDEIDKLALFASTFFSSYTYLNADLENLSEIGKSISDLSNFLKITRERGLFEAQVSALDSKLKLIHNLFIKFLTPQDIKKKTCMDWDIFCILIDKSHSFGLRHVSSSKLANSEKETGFHGDSLNLNITNFSTWKHFNPLDLPNKNGFTDRDLLMLNPEATSKKDREYYIAKWEKGVRSFINNSWLSSESAFLVVDYGPSGKNRAYDVETFGEGLGKMGKQKVASDAIVDVIYPIQEVMTQEALVDYFFSALVSKLKLFH